MKTLSESVLSQLLVSCLGDKSWEPTFAGVSICLFRCRLSITRLATNVVAKTFISYPDLEGKSSLTKNRDSDAFHQQSQSHAAAYAKGRQA
jgi:hypothetical protein